MPNIWLAIIWPKKAKNIFCIKMQILESDFIEVMRTFGWTPTDEELKDMVNVIDQVEM